VWWRTNSLHLALTDKRALAKSNWRHSREKAYSDYRDALASSGWWEETMQLTTRTIKDEDGNEIVVQGSSSGPSAKICELVIQKVIEEAMLVPALFLRSREGMKAATEASDLKSFLMKAKEKLKSEISNVAAVEMRALGDVGPEVVTEWVLMATEVLWPGNQDCYHRAIYEGQQPDCVPVSENVRTYLTKTLLQIQGTAETEYVEPSGNFFHKYSSLYKRFAGDKALQIHFFSLQLAIRFCTALGFGLLTGPLQTFLLTALNALEAAVVAAICPYKNRIQNLKELLQGIMRTYVLLLAFIMTPRTGEGIEMNFAANEGTLLSVLVAGALIDSISPVLGTLRSLFGFIFVCLRLHRRGMVLNSGFSLFLRYTLGKQRTRSVVAVRSAGKKRPAKDWNERKLRKHAKKLMRDVQKNAQEDPTEIKLMNEIGEFCKRPCVYCCYNDVSLVTSCYMSPFP
jgi:hypothetical protein